MNFWNLFKEMENLQGQLSDLAKEFDFDKLSKRAFVPGFSARHFPLMNVRADDNALYVEALTPGVEPSSLKVSSQKETLTISGEKFKIPVGGETYHRCERGSGRFTRTLDLPVEVEPENVKAEYKNGILSLTMPRAQTAKAHQIEVKLD